MQRKHPWLPARKRSLIQAGARALREGILLDRGAGFAAGRRASIGADRRPGRRDGADRRLGAGHRDIVRNRRHAGIRHGRSVFRHCHAVRSGPGGCDFFGFSFSRLLDGLWRPGDRRRGARHGPGGASGALGQPAFWPPLRRHNRRNYRHGRGHGISDALDPGAVDDLVAYCLDHGRRLWLWTGQQWPRRHGAGGFLWHHVARVRHFVSHGAVHGGHRRQRDLIRHPARLRHLVAAAFSRPGRLEGGCHRCTDRLAVSTG